MKTILYFQEYPSYHDKVMGQCPTDSIYAVLLGTRHSTPDWSGQKIYYDCLTCTDGHIIRGGVSKDYLADCCKVIPEARAKLLKPLLCEPQESALWDHILQVISDRHGILPALIKSKTRLKPYPQARYEALFFLDLAKIKGRISPDTCCSMAQRLGYVTHSSYFHARNKVKDWMMDKHYKEEIEGLAGELGMKL